MDKVSHIASRLGFSISDIEARGLSIHSEPEILSVAHISDSGREYLLTPKACVAWNNMRCAAAFDGIEIFLVSAFRSIDHQADLIQSKLDQGILINDVLTVLAPPGFSEHHTGRAIDISTPGVEVLQEDFDKTLAFFWLMNNAYRFNFKLSYPKNNSQGYIYEPWHWCWHP